MKLRPFELGLVIIFVVLAMLALFLLATYESDPKSNEEGPVVTGPVVIWGTLPAAPIATVLRELAESNESFANVSYRYFRPEEFDETLTNALADNRGPDLVLLSHERLVETRRRLQPLSYDSFPLRDIRNLYLDGAQIFALSDGLYGYPIAVDPLMMYWNRDILATEGYLDPPATWETLINDVFPTLIRRNDRRIVERSVVAMGEYENVRNAFGILSTLLTQGGSGRVVESAGTYQVQLQVVPGKRGTDPFRAAADFYTRFSRPTNSLYSWNRSLPEDRQQFIAEDLVLYFGYASEGPVLERLNPNLSFDIAEVPQGANATTRRTYGKFYALSLLRSSKNQGSALLVMNSLGSANTAERIATRSDLVPVYRSTVAAGSNDRFGRVSYQSAPITFGWLNPDREATDVIFKTMTQDINENRRNLSGAVSDATTRIANEL